MSRAANSFRYFNSSPEVIRLVVNVCALRRHGTPEAITTDGLRSYGTAMDALGCREKQEVGRSANNRVENSHLPFR